MSESQKTGIFTLDERNSISAETKIRARGKVSTYPISLKAKRENPLAKPHMALITDIATRMMSKMPNDNEPIENVQSIVSF